MGKNLMKELQRRQRLEEAMREARGIVADADEELLRKADYPILYTLNVDYKFGAKKAEEFYFKLIENQYKLIEEYRLGKDDDESHYAIMRNRLLEKGIDVDALQKKAEAIKDPEPKYIERQMMIKEMLERGDNTCH